MVRPKRPKSVRKVAPAMLEGTNATMDPDPPNWVRLTLGDPGSKQFVNHRPPRVAEAVGRDGLYLGSLYRAANHHAFFGITPALARIYRASGRAAQEPQRRFLAGRNRRIAHGTALLAEGDVPEDLAKFAGLVAERLARTV
jgi:hypothetical protein